MRKLKHYTKYFFNNTRGNGEAYLIIDRDVYDHYGCKYYDHRGEFIRDGKFSRHGTFAQGLREQLKDFFVLWVEGCEKPVQKKYRTLEEAKEGADYLMRKGVTEVFVLKKEGVIRPTQNYKYSEF